MKTKPKYRSIAILIALIVCSTSPAPTAQSQTTKSAPAILESMLAKYGQVESYQDVGEFRVFRHGSRLDNQRHRQNSQLGVSFRTFFLRPNLFRFDWLNSLTRTSRNSTIWFDGEQSYIWALEKMLGND